MPEVPPFSPVVSILALARTWQEAVSAALAPMGLTTRKMGLLGHIRSTPGISFSELARRSHITVQSVHAAVAVLVADGLVDDGTAQAGAASTLRVTADGDGLLLRALDAVAELDRTFAGRYPELAEALEASMVQALQDAP